MKNRISNLTQGKELPIMNLRLSKALVMLLLCCMLIGFADQNASAASAFDRSAFRIAINDMYFEDSASNWYLAGDTGFHVLSDDSNVYADVSIVLNYGAALGGNKQSDVAPVMAIRICETEYGSVHDLQPVTLAFKVANKNYLFTSFTAARGNGNEGFYEIPLGTSFRSMLNEMDKVQTVDLSIHFQNGAIYDTMPLMGVNVSQYFGRWLDFGYFMDVSYMWENMSSSAYTAAEKHVTVKTANR